MVHGAGPDDATDWHRTDEWELAARQLRAIAAFHHARAIAAWASASGERSRAAREQDARRMEVLRRKHAAVIRRAHEQLLASGVPRPAPGLRRRVVLADHGADDELVGGLEDHGLSVVACVVNGADAVGITLVEQPDAVVVGERLDMLRVEEVVHDVRRYSPETRIVALAPHERAHACAAAGATVVLDGDVPTADLVGHLVRVLGQRRPLGP
jgi:hypothetical protein